MVIGLYDIDFNHGVNFCLSLPLMKSYNRLSSEGHIAVMMRPYEQTGRFNKIFYFKENKNLRIPNALKINLEKGRPIGYGFYGSSGLKDETKKFAADFFPYESNYDKVKNKSLFKSIISNSLIDWREKDFANYNPKSGIIYINDQDFLLEDDWEDVFQAYNKNICFVHSLTPKNVEQGLKFIEHNYINTKINFPITYDIDLIKHLLQFNGISIKYDDAIKLFYFIFLIKTFSKEKFYYLSSNEPFTKKIVEWGQQKEIMSFADFCKQKYGVFDEYDKSYYQKVPSVLLRQNPSKMKPEDFKNNYIKI